MNLSEFRKTSLRSTAKQLGISATHLHDIENGKKVPSIELFNKIKESELYEKEFFDFFDVITVQKVVPHWL